MTIQVGSGDTPALLIHGSGSGAQAMERIARLMHAEAPSLQVWIPHLSGYGGDSFYPDDPVDQYLSILEAIVADFSRPCLIVGHSMGGLLGLKLAVRLAAAGTRVLGVVAIEPTAFGMLTEPADQAVRQEDRDVSERMETLMEAGDTEAGIAGFIEYWNQTPWHEMPAALREQLMELAPQIRSEVAAVTIDTTRSYPITAPVHLMYGEDSPAPAQRIVRRLAESLESASVEMIPQAGHMSVIRRPEKYLAGILRLLDL